MLLFRSLTTGMLGACLYFVLQQPSHVPAGSGPAVPAAPAAARSIPATVIDVAGGVSALMVPSLVHLGPGEHIAAVDDRDAASDLSAGAMIADRARAGSFVDLTVVSGPRGPSAPTRRVLVLMH